MEPFYFQAVISIMPFVGLQSTNAGPHTELYCFFFLTSTHAKSNAQREVRFLLMKFLTKPTGRHYISVKQIQEIYYASLIVLSFKAAEDSQWLGDYTYISEKKSINDLG